jgi:hypothetical protein
MARAEQKPAAALDVENGGEYDGESRFGSADESTVRRDRREPRCGRRPITA